MTISLFLLQSSDPAYDLTDSEDDLTNVSHDSPAPPISTSMQRFEAEDVSPRAPSMRKAAERIHDAVKVTNAMRPLEAAESKVGTHDVTHIASCSLTTLSTSGLYANSKPLAPGQ